MKLPIDTSNTMIVAGTVEPVIDFDTKRQRADQNGEPLWSVELVSFCEDGTQVWSARVAGEPRGLAPGQPVRVRELVAHTWEMEGRHGISFRAASVEPASGSAGKPSAAPAAA
jgi:hypothetical protein